MDSCSLFPIRARVGANRSCKTALMLATHRSPLEQRQSFASHRTASLCKRKTCKKTANQRKNRYNRQLSVLFGLCLFSCFVFFSHILPNVYSSLVLFLLFLLLLLRFVTGLVGVDGARACGRGYVWRRSRRKRSSESKKRRERGRGKKESKLAPKAKAPLTTEERVAEILSRFVGQPRRTGALVAFDTPCRVPNKNQGRVVPLWCRYGEAGNTCTVAATGTTPHATTTCCSSPYVPSDSAGTISDNRHYSTGAVKGHLLYYEWQAGILTGM